MNIASNCESRHRIEFELEDLTDGAICFGIPRKGSIVSDKGERKDFDGFPPIK